MKIFISWSGERSRLTAQLLRDWLKYVLKDVDPWLSSEDLASGTRWFTTIMEQLAQSQHGIICLTKTNRNRPWVLFEAGAIVKGLDDEKIYPFLVDLKDDEVDDPLGQFQATLPNKESMKKLVLSINSSLGERGSEPNVLDHVFETFWPQFNKSLKQIIKDTPDEEITLKAKPEKDTSDILRAISRLSSEVSNMKSQINSQSLPLSNFVDTSNLKLVNYDPVKNTFGQKSDGKWVYNPKSNPDSSVITDWPRFPKDEGD